MSLENIGIRFGQEGVPEVKKSITQLQAQLQRFRRGLDQATGVDSIARLNRAIQVTETRIKSLQGSTGSSNSGFNNIEKGANKASDALAKVKPAVDKASFALTNAIPSAVGKATTSLNSVKPGADKAAFALTNFGRVAQDLPFGLVGIQNNITPLFESFKRLRDETGSSKAAFAALGASLAGPGGILFLISALPSIFVIAQNGIAGFNKKSKEAKEAADELKKSLRSIASIENEAAGGIQGQVAQVNALANAVLDTNKAYKERKNALDQLKEINKSYFGDLTLEAAKLAGLKGSVEEYTKALTQQAIIKAFSDEIGNLAKQQATAGQELLQSKLDLLRAQKLQEAAFKQFGPLEKGRADAIKNNVAAQKAYNDVVKKNSDLQTQRNLLENQLNKAYETGLKLRKLDTNKPEKDKKEIDLIQQRIDALKKLEDEFGRLTTAQKTELLNLEIQLIIRDGAKQGFSTEEIAARIKKLRDQIGLQPVNLTVGLVTDGGEGLSKLAEKIGTLKIPTEVDIEVKLLGKGIADAIEKSKKAAEDMKTIILNGTLAIIQSVGEGLGDILAGAFSGDIFSGLKAAASTILGTIGTVLQEIGKHLIVTSTLLSKLQDVINGLLLPGGATVGIGFGIALIALGVALKNIKFGSKMPGFANGVTNFSGGTAIVGERGSEIVNLPRGANVIPNGGFGNITLLPSLEISGTKLALMLERVNQQRNKLG